MTACAADRAARERRAGAGRATRCPRVVEQQALALGAEAQRRIGAEDGDAAHTLVHVHEGRPEAPRSDVCRSSGERSAGGGETDATRGEKLCPYADALRSAAPAATTPIAASGRTAASMPTLRKKRR